MNLLARIILLGLLALVALAGFAQQTVQVPVPASQVTAPAQNITIPASTTPLKVDLTNAPGCTATLLASTLAVNCGVVPPPTCPAQIKPTGSNDTANWTEVLDNAATARQCVEIFPGTYSLGANLNFPSNSNVKCDEGVYAKATGSFPTGSIWLDFAQSNITFAGPADKGCTFDMSAIPVISGDQWRHIVWLNGANNVTISGITVTGAKGDGAYLANCNLVTLTGNAFLRSYRNNVSVTDKAKNWNISGNELAFARGTNPEAGIDFEPNMGIVGNFFGPGVFNSNNVHDNNENGIFLDIYAPLTTLLSFTANDNISDNNGQYGFICQNSNNGSDQPGVANVTNLQTSNSGFGGAYCRKSNGGWTINFINPIIVNSNVRGNDPHYSMNSALGVGLTGGEPSSVLPGGVNWTNVVISNTNKNMANYMQPGSPVNTTFNCKSCSGATNSGAATKYP